MLCCVQIRVWGLYTRDQIYEFYSANETATCCAYHPIQSEYRLACGFASGAMRILDIASTTMHVDYQQHTGAVVSILFSNDGSTLYTVGLDGNLCSYDTIKNYLPVRMFTTYRHQPVHISPALPTNVVKRREEREQQQNEQEDSLNQSSTSANGASTKTIKAYGREKDTKLEKRNRILYALAINGKLVLPFVNLSMFSVCLLMSSLVFLFLQLMIPFLPQLVLIQQL